MERTAQTTASNTNLAATVSRWLPRLWHRLFLRDRFGTHVEEELALKVLLQQRAPTGQGMRDIDGVLQLSDRKLIALPASLATNPKLLHARTLNCEDNILNELPLFLGDLVALRCLLFANNAFTALASNHLQFLGQRLTNLTELDLSQNCLQFFPLDGFPKLCTLRLDHNRLLEVPHTISRLTRLAALHVSHNQLSVLPDMLPQSLAVLGM